MTLARVAVIGVLAVAVIAVGIVLFGGDSGTKYTLIFQNASQLVNDDDVQIGGRRVGSITSIELTDHNQAAVGIELDDDYAPLHEGTTAIVRLTSLSGVANRYIALTPGPSNARALDDGSTLRAESTTSAVDLDQLFNTLNPSTRKGLQNLIQGFAAQYEGKGPEANEALKYFSPALSTTSAIASELTKDQKSFTDFVINTAGLVTSLSQRSQQITSLVSNANTTAGAIASQNSAFSQALAVLPQTLRQGSTTFVNLRATLDDLTKLVDVSKPATKNLASFLKTVRPLLTQATPTLNKLAVTFLQPGPHNDLADQLTDAPTLRHVTSTAAPNTIKALEKSTPVLKFLRPYTPEFVGWIRDFGQSSSNYDANGHYARVQPVFGAYKYTSSDNTLNPQPLADRIKGLTNGQVKRCPGAASQFPADGSAPFRDTNGKLDCDPSLAIPGT
jgi:phospholipid/cholesterol/gamma-HCH transport system substrate-binding protein